MPSIRFIGTCLNKDDDYDLISENERPSVNSPEECHQKCHGESDCVAFRVEKPSLLRSSHGCILFAKGPYTHGNGDGDMTCYAMSGEIYCFHKYESWEFNC